MNNKFFKTDDGFLLPVNEKKYLIPFLTGTSKGTKYYEPAPINKIAKAYLADKLLQFHQFIDIFMSLNINLINKSFLDVGTGNGLIPKTLLVTNFMKKVLGTDLYSPYEHESASIPLENQVEKKFYNFLKKSIKNGFISYKNYKKYLKSTAEGEVFQPQDISIKNINIKKINRYNYKKKGAHELKHLKQKFDIVYCKGIEHIPDWKITVENFNFVTKKNSYIYLKTRPFYSYLGPHRFATSAIPWGHALLKDSEYKRYVFQFHKNRAKKMINSYYDTITFPRYSIDELIRFFEKSNFSLVCQKIETPPYSKKILQFKNDIKSFDNILKKKGHINNSELASSVQHFVFQKIL